MLDFTPTKAIQPLIPSVDYTAPLDQISLVVAQLTRFRCGDVCLGLGVSHVMADGPSALHFVTEWTKFARGDAARVRPGRPPPATAVDRGKANLDPVGGVDTTGSRPWPRTSGAARARRAAEQQTSLHFVADFRNKINPPLPKNYFGNALIRVEATDRSGSLLAERIGAASR
ncbi:hypothetical protein SASPL_129600 [Salvia splendens]|uniref:Shikimate O-hydroxycinnamoyltransferase n=1 Tax=Salvia splendens TaxID=180675 RepID=A0A8X8XEQ8_SALSN|nr:hypothetical protein SASPL_129600 [Salvia splendens]